MTSSVSRDGGKDVVAPAWLPDLDKQKPLAQQVRHGSFSISVHVRVASVRTMSVLGRLDDNEGRMSATERLTVQEACQGFSLGILFRLPAT
jgi:hypothetical protein